MKKISLAILTFSIFAMTACGDGGESSNLSASIAPNAITIKRNQFGVDNKCGGGAPRVVFGGTDAAGHALFNVITDNIQRIPQVGRDSSCDINPVLLFPGLKIRVKGITFAGSWSVQNNAVGSIDVMAGPRTAFTFKASQPVFQNNPSFLKSDFSFRADRFTNCGDSSLGEILTIRPSVTVRQGITGRPPAIFPTIRQINISIDAVKC